MNDLICTNERRREKVRKHTQLRGLDYLEVGDLKIGDDKGAQRKLTVHFLGKGLKLDETNVVIEGGRRIRDLRVTCVEFHCDDDPERDDIMTVVVDRAGDFSTYTLRIVERKEQGRLQPHPAFDPRYDRVEFSFKVDCPSDLDCKVEPQCPPVNRAEPEISYLAKDYASFKQLIHDRLALVMPDWPGWMNRRVPDFGVAMVELMAYVGDYLSYYQDAVATEAYLDTARQRISVRRHARLVDYQMHEGCNARAWMVIETSGQLSLDPRDTFFITGSNDAHRNIGIALTEDDLRQLPSGGYEIFEPMANREIKLYESHNRIRFYTWGDEDRCIDRGATAATLMGKLAPETQAPDPPPDKCDPPQLQSKELLQAAQATSQTTLDLQRGDVLIFEEVLGAKTGNPADADPNHRHAVRLTSVEGATDKLNGERIVNIEWAEEDALPFPLCLSVLGPPPDCKIICDISVARGNVVLVDHGRSVEEDLDEVPKKKEIKHCEGEGMQADTSIIPQRYRPQLRQGPLTFSQPLANGAPVSQSLRQDARQALPWIGLTGAPAPLGDPRWVAQRDLLGSSGADQHFVAEIENDGRARLRFGDGELGRIPAAMMKFRAKYRAGNGAAGNVGAEAISHLVTRQTRLSGSIAKVRNPMPAVGGTPPEPVAEVRLFAPHALRRELQRAIIADDYAAIVQREFRDKTQRAAATLRWNGSWYEALVAVDQFGKSEADPALLGEIAKRLHRYRRIGHDVTVKSARLVPVEIELMVCVHPHYLRGHVKAALFDLFSNRVLPSSMDGRKGFFHPDNLSFGDGIYLSKIVAAAQAVVGVESVEVKMLKRFGEDARGEIENGVLPLGPLEVAQLDNDPSFPEHGKLTLTMEGGR